MFLLITDLLYFLNFDYKLIVKLKFKTDYKINTIIIEWLHYKCEQ